MTKELRKAIVKELAKKGTGTFLYYSSLNNEELKQAYSQLELVTTDLS